MEHGSGRALSESFNIKLWPTLIFFADGQEVAQLVRPTDADDVAQVQALGLVKAY